jgi:Phosphate transport (Pho88)
MVSGVSGKRVAGVVISLCGWLFSDLHTATAASAHSHRVLSLARNRWGVSTATSQRAHGGCIGRIGLFPRGGAESVTGEESDDDSSDDDDDDDDEQSVKVADEGAEEEEEDDEESDSEEEDEEEEDGTGSIADDIQIELKVQKFDEPLVASPLTNLYASIGVMLLARRVDLFHPTVVRIARIAFIAYVVLLQLFLFYVRVEAKRIDDRTPIELTNPLSAVLAGQLGGGSNSRDGGGAGLMKNLASSFLSSKSTVLEYDLKQAKGMQSGLIFNMLMMWFLHFKMNQVQPLLIQTANGIMSLVYSPLFQVYVLGRNLERPFVSQAAAKMEQAAAKANAAGAEANKTDSDAARGNVKMAVANGDDDDEDSESEEAEAAPVEDDEGSSDDDEAGEEEVDDNDDESADESDE